MARFSTQKDFFSLSSRQRWCAGGDLRRKRAGRKARPLARKHSLHVVLKADKRLIKTGLRTYRRYFLVLKILQTFAARFNIKIEQYSIQYDHIHLLIRLGCRSDALNFFRVLAGQIAQNFQQRGLMVTDTPTKLWTQRPFTRVVLGARAMVTIKNYLKLNELEALRLIPYRKTRLKGLSEKEWELLGE